MITRQQRASPYSTTRHWTTPSPVWTNRDTSSSAMYSMPKKSRQTKTSSGNFSKKCTMEAFAVMILRHGPQAGEHEFTWSSLDARFLSDRLNRPLLSTHGVIDEEDVGQSDFLWSVRSNQLINRVFTQIWSDQALLVSFDGFGVLRDWRYKSDWKTKGAWNHVDQNRKIKPNRCCIQGFVSLTDQSERTGGLIVYPQSHLHFTELVDVCKNKKDYVKVLDNHPIMRQGKTMGNLVHCRAGDLVLWDSRTIHCNSPATAPAERSPNQPVDLLRIVAYVCTMPVSFIDADKLEHFREQRQQILENNQTLTHWSTTLVVGGQHTIDDFSEGDFSHRCRFSCRWKEHRLAQSILRSIHRLSEGTSLRVLTRWCITRTFLCFWKWFFKTPLRLDPGETFYSINRSEISRRMQDRKGNTEHENRTRSTTEVWRETQI